MDGRDIGHGFGRADLLVTANSLVAPRDHCGAALSIDNAFLADRWTSAAEQKKRIAANKLASLLANARKLYILKLFD
ncbi:MULTISPECIES: hypothetical protein [unclassified Bradyrhizobium]|uniref:hypothetical protein n=1 Tax=unclassified Bradyrhizobium TaxID=2631580 RepID=UPI001CD2FD94|nr:MULTISPECIES: hypothetical protein [unclassified Bradyrhizobium]MCA1373480.1 hypothetical protein [Bradyrhizobium sp. IC4060]MCA1488677.1 hypothetical protein [Bradyrhizobium sp. IC4061]